MSIFKRTKTSTDKDTKESEGNKKEKKSDEPKIVKKTKIGFRSKKKKTPKKDTSQQSKKEDEKSVEVEQEEFEIENNNIPKQKSEIKTDEIEVLPDEIIGDEGSDTLKKETQWTSSKKKKKRIITTDMKGKPVFLEDTGEKLGIVFDMILDGEKKIVGYKIKDQKSESVLSFPVDQFDETKDGLIFLQSWYINALKTLEKLEFKERVSPELTTLITDDAISNEELYNIFVKHDDQMANYIEEAISLKELLYKRLKALEKQRLVLKDSLMDLTEKRLIKDIDRREFSEDVMAHRRKVNVLDVNISKCKELIKRLDSTSFGKLGEHLATQTVIDDKSQYLRHSKEIKDDSNLVLAEEIENPYKQKYNDIKGQFEQLQEDYNELKSAVEKLMSKDEI
ncbi:MAG: PRC-barrel domain-containing protein [Thermoplasmatales archaeon]|nr:PRC-barrel domain-containing protein [Thermoplasmatales archaeon]MCK4995475.1 PRC-barrel domain-containing protein [Thermoplasmatales archaeon]